MAFNAIIFFWSGLIADIPTNFVLCDGNNNTPDLRNLFVIGSGDTYNPDNTDPTDDHDHDFTTNGHQHLVAYYPDFPAVFTERTSTEVMTGTTDKEDNSPPYYALAFIMHKGF